MRAALSPALSSTKQYRHHGPFHARRLLRRELLAQCEHPHSERARAAQGEAVSHYAFMCESHMLKAWKHPKFCAPRFRNAYVDSGYVEQLERIQGMPSTVLHIISLPESSPPVRQAAAVYLKNRISRSWSTPYSINGSSGSSAVPRTSNGNMSSNSTSPTNIVPLADADKVTIKQNILHVLVETPQQNVKVQLKTCLGTIIAEDFPEKWEELMHQSIQCIQSGHENQIEGGLLALIEILKIYRSVEASSRKDAQALPSCSDT